MTTCRQQCALRVYIERKQCNRVCVWWLVGIERGILHYHNIVRPEPVCDHTLPNNTCLLYFTGCLTKAPSAIALATPEASEADKIQRKQQNRKKNTESNVMHFRSLAQCNDARCTYNVLYIYILVMSCQAIPIHIVHCNVMDGWCLDAFATSNP